MSVTRWGVKSRPWPGFRHYVLLLTWDRRACHYPFEFGVNGRAECRPDRWEWIKDDDPVLWNRLTGTRRPVRLRSR